VILAAIPVAIVGNGVIGEKFSVEDHDESRDPLEESGKGQCSDFPRGEVTVADASTAVHSSTDDIVGMPIGEPSHGFTYAYLEVLWHESRVALVDCVISRSPDSETDRKACDRDEKDHSPC
jgi:hypothetical protein